MFKNSKTFTSFSTNDLKKAKDFYEKTLGLNLNEDEKMGIINIRLANGNLMIYPKDNHEPATYTVLNFIVDDIETAVDDLKTRGVHFESYSDPSIKTNEKGISRWDGGPAMAWFKDPAGNILALMQE